jgi:hypothetical protein
MPRRSNVDKQIITVANDAITTTGESTLLYTVTVPGTVVGLLWDFDIYQDTLDSGAFSAKYGWAIHVVPQPGDAVTTKPLLADTNDFFTPEQHVLAWGTGVGIHTALTEADNKKNFKGTTKTKRRMYAGDKLYLTVRCASATDKVAYFGAVQFFISR